MERASLGPCSLGKVGDIFMANEITRNLLDDELMHYGVMGMKWGVRRYQPYGEGGYDPDHKGKYVGPSSTQSGPKPTFREKLRAYEKAGRALTRASEYSRDRRIANRAERLQKGFVKREQKRYGRAVKKGNEKKINEHALKLEQEKKTQQALKDLQQELTNQINASFVTGRTRHPISKPVTKFFESINDICSDLPLISTLNLTNLGTTYRMRRVVQNAMEESNVMGTKLNDVIQQNMREEINTTKRAQDVARAARY